MCSTISRKLLATGEAIKFQEAVVLTFFPPLLSQALKIGHEAPRWKLAPCHNHNLKYRRLVLQLEDS